jgi:hypothetical protein
VSAEEEIRQEVERFLVIVPSYIGGQLIPSDEDSETRIERLEIAVMALYRGLLVAGEQMDHLIRALDAR